LASCANVPAFTYRDLTPIFYSYRIHLSPGSRRRSTAASRTAIIRSYGGDQPATAKRGSQSTLSAQLPPINYPSPPPPPPPSPPIEPPALEQAYSHMPPGPDSPPPLVQAPLPALMSPYAESGSSRSASPPECVLAPLSLTSEYLPVANYPLGMPSQPHQYGEETPAYQTQSQGAVYSYENDHSHSQPATVDNNGAHSNGIQEQSYNYANSYSNHHAAPHISTSPTQPTQHIDNTHTSASSSPNQYSPISSRHSISHISHPQAYSHAVAPYPPASVPPSPASVHSGSSRASLGSGPHTPAYTYQDDVPEPSGYHSGEVGFEPISDASCLPTEYYGSQNEIVTNGYTPHLASHVPGSYSNRYLPSSPVLAPTQERLVHGDMQHHAHHSSAASCMTISEPTAQLSPYLHHPRPISGTPQYHLPHVSLQPAVWGKSHAVLPAIHH
jgi:zinc finger protein CreA/MIG